MRLCEMAAASKPRFWQTAGGSNPAVHIKSAAIMDAAFRRPAAIMAAALIIFIDKAAAIFGNSEADDLAPFGLWQSVNELDLALLSPSSQHLIGDLLGIPRPVCQHS